MTAKGTIMTYLNKHEQNKPKLNKPEINKPELNRIETFVKKNRIMLIDDNEDALLLNKTLLKIEGYEVITSLGGRKALELLNETEKPDLILLDFQMNDINGPEFLTLLEQARPDIIAEVPVVFLSGMNEVPKSKAVGFIRKASNIETFLLDIRGFLNR
jgi:CheY-like chemotaxis protein